MKKLQPLTGPVSFWELLVIAYIVLYHTGYSSWPWWYPWAALLLPHIFTIILDRVFADEEIDTNDPHQSRPKDQDPPKREPMLSEGRMAGLIATETDNLPQYVGEGVRDFYEAKITSGELILVRKLGEGGEVLRFCCRNCQEALVSFFDGDKCKCGAKISE